MINRGGLAVLPRERPPPNLFKDGVAGRVPLRPEEMAGALAPLLGEPLYHQVFVDCGAVAWPGEIDVAPDAMYAQIAGQRVG